MDLGASGWFNDPGMWAQMKRLDALDAPLLAHPTPFRPEVAAVIDERSMRAVAAGGVLVTGPGVYEARAQLGRMGAPYGQYLLDDVLAGRVHAKLLVFLNAWNLSKADREGLLRAARGSARIWCYAPGWLDEGHGSPEAMRELTGFELKPAATLRAWATPTEAGKRLGLRKAFGLTCAPRPLFCVADATPEEALATYQRRVNCLRFPLGPRTPTTA